MAKTYTIPMTQNIKSPAVSLLPADTTVAKTLFTAGAEGSLLRALTVNSTDSVARVIELILNDGSTDRVLGALSIPALSGTDGTVAAVDLMNSTLLPGLRIDSNGKRAWGIQATYVLKVRAVVTVTAAKQINVIGDAEDF